MPYKFQILGPVSVFHDGQRLPPGPPKRRAMITALRRQLGDRVRTRTRAYELRLDDGELDAAEFGRLARDGRQALTDGSPAKAISSLRAALALWNGAAGDGLPPGTSLQTRLLALDEQRLEVFEDHIEARLHTGAYDGIAADLRRHLATRPTQERCWELLILALYRSGNTSGALEAYRQARTRLREHLGIEPGPRLEELHRAVLRHDKALEGAAPAQTATIAAPRPAPGTRVATPPPFHPLPVRGPVLLGRERELATLGTVLRGEHPAVVVTGKPGIGKSTLAVHAAQAVRADYPGGQLVLDLAIAREVPGPPDPDDQPTLLLVENVTSTAQVRPLLGWPVATVLLVSRRRLSGLDHAAHVEIGPVGDDDAARILAEYAGSGWADAGTVCELVRLCDGVPLALRIVGAWLASGNVSPAMLAQHLRNRPLDGLVVDDLSVRDALATEYRTVAEQDPVTARALPALGSLEPGATTTPEELAVRLGEDPSLVFFALERLVAAWLVQSPTPGRYGVTGLTRAYAAELPADNQQQRRRDSESVQRSQQGPGR